MSARPEASVAPETPGWPPTKPSAMGSWPGEYLEPKGWVTSRCTMEEVTQSASEPRADGRDRSSAYCVALLKVRGRSRVCRLPRSLKLMGRRKVDSPAETQNHVVASESSGSRINFRLLSPTVAKDSNLAYLSTKSRMSANVYRVQHRCANGPRCCTVDRDGDYWL
jgi:hypothetical protein